MQIVEVSVTPGRRAETRPAMLLVGFHRCLDVEQLVIVRPAHHTLTLRKVSFTRTGPNFTKKIIHLLVG